MPPIDAPQTRRARDAQGVEQGQCIGGHVGQRIRRTYRQAQPPAQGGHGQIRHAPFVETLAQAGVAIVEADHAVAACHQVVDQGLGPGDELHAQAHDQQHRFTVARAALVDLEHDLAGTDLHQRGISTGRPALRAGGRP
jgi:hypothetical protein